VKSLLSRGSIVADSFLASVGVEIIALTWFLSVIYMSKLMFCLFLAPGQAPLHWLKGLNLYQTLARKWGTSSGKISCLVFISLLCVATSIFYCSELAYIGAGVFGSSFDPSVFIAMPL
jgi:hypothetical protein